TNELFLLTSAAGYLRTENKTYLENANKEWAWLSASGMRGPNGLFNDGLALKTCRNNEQTTWTYNQAVVASGLAALYAATNDTSLLDQAEVSLDATMNWTSSLTDNGLLRESCDSAASGDKNCNRDQQIFKGIWTKHVQYYLDNANDTSRIAKYSDFLGSQYSGIVDHATNSDRDVGSVWYDTNQGGSQWSPEASASGLQALISAAKVRRSVMLRHPNSRDCQYGPCNH
ncbi:glycoside hydrolase, partial [Suillus ampliporus]